MFETYRHQIEHEDENDYWVQKEDYMTEEDFHELLIHCGLSDINKDDIRSIFEMYGPSGQYNGK